MYASSKKGWFLQYRHMSGLPSSRIVNFWPTEAFLICILIYLHSRNNKKVNEVLQNQTKKVAWIHVPLIWLGDNKVEKIFEWSSYGDYLMQNGLFWGKFPPILRGKSRLRPHETQLEGGWSPPSLNSGSAPSPGGKSQIKFYPYFDVPWCFITFY